MQVPKGRDQVSGVVSVHSSQMFYENHSSSVQSIISRGLSLHMVRWSYKTIWSFTVSTIKLPKWRFQAFLDVSLFEKFIWKSRGPQDKTSIRGASPGISYKLRNKGAIGGRGWNIASQERKICYVEIEIVTFVINGSVKLTVPPDRQK